MKKYFHCISIFFRVFRRNGVLQECVDYAVKIIYKVISNQYNVDIQAKNLEISKETKTAFCFG